MIHELQGIIIPILCAVVVVSSIICIVKKNVKKVEFDEYHFSKGTVIEGFDGKRFKIKKVKRNIAIIKEIKCEK